jgi:hypothetical protein
MWDLGSLCKGRHGRTSWHHPSPLFAACGLFNRARLFRSTPLLAALALCKPTITTKERAHAPEAGVLLQTASPCLVHSGCTLACEWDDSVQLTAC